MQEKSRSQKSTRQKRFFIYSAVFLAVFLFSLLLTRIYIGNKIQLEHSQMEQLVLVKSNKINDVLSKLLYRTQTLSALVIQNNGEIENFEQVAATIIDDPCIRNVILAPNGVVSNVYPFEGNEAVIGLDYFSESAGNTEAAVAYESGRLVLGGPFESVQGGQVLVGRLPVYINASSGGKQFWGLVSVTLSYPAALDGAELNQLKNQGFAYEIWRISPDTNSRQVISCSNYQYNQNSRYVEQPLFIQNAEWYFRLSPIRNWYQFPETWICVIAGFFVSALAGGLVLHNHDLKQMKSELEALTIRDPLTGSYNRRGILQILDSLTVHPETPFLLCYIDLNRFKAINDTYGHSAGDQVLLSFSNTIHRLTHKISCRFGRIGGDEFVIIFMNTSEKAKIEAWLKDLSKHLTAPIPLGNGQSCQITISAGLSVFPADGITTDELLTQADHKMYLEKFSQKEAIEQTKNP